MSASVKQSRRSVALPSPLARRIQTIAKRENRSANRVIVDLIEAGLDAREREKKAFYDLADRLADASDPTEQKRIKKELARMTYGE